MCQYRYYYYGGCRHQETTLMSLCDRSTSLDATTTEHRGHHPPADSVRRRHREGGAGDRNDSAGSKLPALSPIPSHPSSPSIDPSSPASGSTVPTSLASFQELALDTSSFTSQQHRRRLTDTSVDDMAGLAPFSWKQLMPGTTSKATTAVHPTTAAVYHQSNTTELDNDPRSPSRLRREGSRQQSDNSCHLVNGADALRHITSSCRGEFEAEQFATKNQPSRHSSARFTRGFEHEQPFFGGETFEALEAEVNSLKDELAKMREETQQRRVSDQANCAIASENPAAIRASRTKILAPSFRPMESAAARLQEQHRKQEELLDCAASALCSVPASPPKASDFPELGSHSRGTWMGGHAESSASHGNMANKLKAFNLTVCTSKTYDSDDSLVMMSSPKSQETSPETLGLRPSLPMGEKQSNVNKSSPRFAQPTQAFARRADETLQRKDSVARLDRPSPDGKAPSLRTPTQRSPKRKAIPGSWVTSPTSPSTDVDPKTPTKTSSPTSPQAGHSIDSDKAGELAPMDFSMEPTLRKKVSSYMSPTKAATQRAIATMGAESVKRFSPRLQKAVPRINAAASRPESPAASAILASGAGSPDTVIQTEMDAVSGTKIATNLAQKQPAAAQNGRTSSRHLTVRSTIGTPVVEQLAEQAKAAGLPMPANTTAQRRGSHGHLLLPIKAKLDKVSVLKENPEPRYTSRRSSQRSSDLSSNESASRAAHQTSPIPPLAAQVAPAKPRIKQIFSPATGLAKDLPPECQKGAIDVLQTRSTTELNHSAQANAPIPNKKCVPPHVRAAQKEDARHKAQLAVHEALSHALLGASIPVSGKASSLAQTPSLRATAMEFRPVFQFTASAQEPEPEPEQGLMPAINQVDLDKFYSAEEWAMLSPQVKKSICTLRNFKSGRSNSMCVPRTNHLGYTAKPHGDFQRNWSAQLPAMLQDQVPDVFHVSPQAGQILEPHLSPQSQAVRWTMTDGSGYEMPLSFGRAASPVAFSPHTPQLSHASNDVSPGAHWTIGSSGRHRSVYGWSGGDGKEIKFVGYGPNAERDPNDHAKIQFHNKGKAQASPGPRMINGEDEHGGSPGQPLAPRSRRQWAERLNLPKIPCNEMNIEAATEMVPLPDEPKLWGHCPDCSDSRH